MTEHEPDPNQHHGHPEESARLPVPPDDLGPALLDEALEAMHRYSAAVRRRDPAFAAYLELDRTPGATLDEDADFRARYIGHYPDRSGFVRAQITENGWDQALTDLQVDVGIWPGDLTWDEDVLLDHLSERFELVDGEEGVYAFRV